MVLITSPSHRTSVESWIETASWYPKPGHEMSSAQHRGKTCPLGGDVCADLCTTSQGDCPQHKKRHIGVVTNKKMTPNVIEHKRTASDDDSSSNSVTDEISLGTHFTGRSGLTGDGKTTTGSSMSENQGGGAQRPGYINPVIAKAEQRAIMKAKLGLLFLLILGVITITTAALVLLLNEVDATFRSQVSDSNQYIVAAFH